MDESGRTPEDASDEDGDARRASSWQLPWAGIEVPEEPEEPEESEPSEAGPEADATPAGIGAPPVEEPRAAAEPVGVDEPAVEEPSTGVGVEEGEPARDEVPADPEPVTVAPGGGGWAGPGGPRGRRRRRRGRVLLVLLGVLVVAGMAASIPLQLARGAMERGREEASAAQQALAAGDLDGAAGALEAAREEFASARRTLRNPLTLAVGFVPGLGSTARTGGMLALAGEITAAATGDLLASLDALPDGVASLAPSGGRFPVDEIERLAPEVRETAEELGRAHGIVRRSPDLLVVEQVRIARRELAAVLERADRTTSSLAAVVEAVPELLGAEGPRTYFFGASNPAELRGTGGFIGVWGLLRFDDGRLTVDDLSSIHELPAVPPDRAVDPPTPGYAERYDRYEARWSWLNANVTPDFPSAAAVLEGLYERAVGEPVDGVIVADPFAIAALLQAREPLDVPDVGRVDEGNVVDVVTNEAYARFDDQDERQEALATVASAALLGFMSEGVAEPEAAVRALAGAVGRGHLLFHASDPDLQARLEAAGVAGALGGALADEPGDVLALAINSQTSAKVDYYLELAADVDVRLLPGGASQAQVVLDVTNHAPTQGQPEYVIGPTLPGLEAGDNRFLLDLFCARTCTYLGFSPERAEDEVRTGTERGHPALGTRVLLPSAETEQMVVEWRTADAWGERDGEVRYRFSFSPPPLVRAPTLRVRVALPPDLRLVEVPEGAEVVDGAVLVQTADRGVTTVELGFERSGADRLWGGIREELRRPLIRLGGNEDP